MLTKEFLGMGKPTHWYENTSFLCTADNWIEKRMARPFYHYMLELWLSCGSSFVPTMQNSLHKPTKRSLGGCITDNTV